MPRRCTSKIAAAPGARAVLCGFTLLELMIVLTLSAILLILGVPALQGFGANQRMSAAINALHTHLAFARHQAIRFNTDVVVCPGTLDSGCTGHLDWGQGWLVFSDLNGDMSWQNLEPVHRQEPGLEQMVIHSPASRRAIRFYPNGSAPGSNGSITFCDHRGPAKARKLVISNLGRVRRDQAPELQEQHCSPYS